MTTKKTTTTPVEVRLLKASLARSRRLQKRIAVLEAELERLRDALAAERREVVEHARRTAMDAVVRRSWE
jgi:uncharacterized membrane-anchored protein YhcB (DUF1043 family)